MANVIEAKSRTSKGKTKTCLKCGKAKELSEFYVNREWMDQLQKDAWCKECVNRCSTKDEVREYFWENNREWDERIWDTAKSKAEKILSTNDVYNRANEDRKNMLLERAAAQQIPTCMMQRYKYVDNSADGKYVSYNDAKEQGAIIEEKDPNTKVYSEEFNGYFKPYELNYLKKYYESLCEENDIITQTHKDYARKMAKASLHADKTQDDWAAGKCDFQLVKDAIAVFDMLSKSANFAPSTKKKDTSGGLGSFSEISLYLETNGHPCTRKIEWEKDDVDKTLSEFMYLTQSLGLDQV